MSGINAGRVRIYKIPTHRFFTEAENTIYKDKKKKNKTSDVEAEILKNESIRSVADDKTYDSDIIAVFESDIVRLALEYNGYDKANMQLLKEIVYLEVYHLTILNQIIHNGCSIFGKRYVFFTATTGQQRNRTVTLVEEDFYKKYKRNITCGLSLEQINRIGQNAGKYIAYNALILSASVPFENKIDLDRCIVVKGLETYVDEPVKYLDVDTLRVSDGYVHIKDDEQSGIPIEHTDGAGMFLPGLQPKSFQIRGRYFKGAMFPFDFRTFATEVAQSTQIVDCYGKEHDIIEEDIQYIFTTSQFKNWKYYDSWDEYKRICKEEGIQLTVNNWNKEPSEKVRFSYQYIQTLPYDSDISGIQENVSSYLNRCKTDLDFALELVGLKYDESDSNPRPLVQALKLYPNLINDPRILQYVKDKVADERRYARMGKFLVDGTYIYIIPDMYAFCEYLFMGEKNPVGLIPKDYVYFKPYDDTEYNHVCVLRSPHLSGYEYGKRDLLKDDECKRWFTGNEVVVSCHDLISKVLQCDWDGDEVLVTPDESIWDLAENKPSLYYWMEKAEAITINDDSIFDTLKKAFENCLVGFISNGESRLWNVDSKEEIDDELICIETAYNNYSIDYPKTGKNLDLTIRQEIWKKHLKYVGDFHNDIKPEVHKPYFFIDKEGKSKKTAEKSDLYAATNDSIMNRINKEVIDESKIARRYKYGVTGDFNYKILMNNEINEDGTPRYQVRPELKYYLNLCELLVQLKKEEADLAQRFEYSDTEDESDKNKKFLAFSLFEYRCISEIKKLFSRGGWYNEQLAVNTLVHVYYNQDKFYNYAPNILWNCYGDILLKNIKTNLNNPDFEIKASKRKAYKQVKIGNKKADEKISDLLADKHEDKKNPIAISKEEYDAIFLGTDKPTNRQKVLFALLCMYKDMLQKQSDDKDTNKTDDKDTKKRKWLRIHVGQKNTQYKGVSYNFSRLDKIADVSNGQSKEVIKDLLKEPSNFFKVKHLNHKTQEIYEIRFNCKQENPEGFTVNDLTYCIVSLYSYGSFNDKQIKTCVECGKKYFDKTPQNHKRTKKELYVCSDFCKQMRQVRQKRTSYLKNKEKSEN